MEDPDDAAPPQDSPSQRVAHVGRGFLMGLADVVPGVSGGTVALVLGIYTRLVRAIRNVDWPLARAFFALARGGAWRRQRFAQEFRRADLLFPMLLLLGIGAALVSAAGVITFLLEAWPSVMLALFFGLILASAWVPWRLIDHRSAPAAALATRLAVAAAAAAVAFVVAGLPVFQGPTDWWFVPVAGAIAICAMILPGISGAFLLVVLGMYDRMLTALHERDAAVLGLFILGAGVGLLSFSRLLALLLGRWRQTTLAALAGLMLGSLRKLWPFKDSYDADFGTGRNVWPAAFDSTVLAAVVAFLAGVALVVTLEVIAARRQPEAPVPDARA